MSRLAEPLVIGSDASIHPLPGQLPLPLAASGYREAGWYPADEDPHDRARTETDR